ncbi:MAG: hypothetical protein WCJ30_10430 [Deltaproteobacteria bacterium]
MHRTTIALIAFCPAIFVSRVAHADLVCGDYLSGDYQPDELTSPTSQSLAGSARSCVCLDECAGVCFAPDGDALCHAAINACVMDL